MIGPGKWALVLAAFTIIAPLAIACSDDDDDGDATPAATTSADNTPAGDDNVILVELVEFSVVPDKATVPAGSLTFRATNNGPEDEHEFVIIRSRPRAKHAAHSGRRQRARG